MPPKKSSIARIRAESTRRSDDPELNRRRAASSSRPSQRYRSVASGSTAASSGGRNKPARPKRQPQPKLSARILQIHDDDIQETRVQNRFAPDARTQRQNVSYRPLSLATQAQRDGEAFQLPTLASMCCTIVATCFDALLPSREHFDAAGGARAAGRTAPIRNSHTLGKASSGRKRSRARAFGAAPDSDDDQRDYVPSDPEDAATHVGSRSTRSRNRQNAAASAQASGSSRLLAGWTTSELHYLTRKTSQQLKVLSPAASFLLFRALVEHAPQYLTKSVVADYFLPPIVEQGSTSTARTLGTTTAARTDVWLPASIPLLSHDKHAASFLVTHLTSAIASVKASTPVQLSQSVEEELPLAMLPPRRSFSQSVTFALRSLRLHGLTRLQDATLARFFEAAIPPNGVESGLLRLDTVSLRGCIGVGDRSVGAMCRATGPSLRYVNLDFTDVTADSVRAIVRLAPHVHTLKLGYNDNLSDRTLQTALEAPTSGAIPLGKLVNLRLRQCAQVGELGVACFLKYVHRTLQVLDISATGVGGANPHAPDMRILLMSFFPAGIPPAGGALALRKLNLLETNIDYDSVVELVQRAPGLETLLLRQMPSRSTSDGLIEMLERIVRPSKATAWSERVWKRLHLRISDVADEFAHLFPDLLATFPRLHVDNLRSSQSQTQFFASVPESMHPSRCIVEHLKLPDARLSDYAWQFLPLITSLHSLDLSNTAVPEAVVKQTIESNPMLDLLDLSHCKQMRISTRRNAFALLTNQ